MNEDGFFNCNIENIFEKKFTFEKKDDWNFLDIVVQEKRWSVDSLNRLKKDLNDTKSLLNDKGQDWHEHTAKINRASFVASAIKERIEPEILTQAWCKFFEVLSSFKLISAYEQSTRSLHLCEAPGAFVSALNYYLCVNHASIAWEWMANTLNPYYEGHSIRNVVVDDRLLFPTLKHWYFGSDNTGDITALNYIEDLCDIVNKTGLFDLITADGSVDCLNNPGEQELVVEKIHFAEILVALNCLLPLGCFVLKKFTFFECSSICQLYLLNCVFEKVHVFKPFTSRPSNSEVYVICIGFQRSEILTNILQEFKDVYSKKNTVAVFPQSAIPDSFLNQVEKCMKFFTGLQIESIKENLSMYPLQSDLSLKKLNVLKQACAEAYIKKYLVFSSSLYSSSKLFSNEKVLPSFNNESHKDLKNLYFQCIGDTFNNIMKSSSMQWYDKLIDVEKRINICFPCSRKRTCERIQWLYPWKEIRSRMKTKNFGRWISCGKRVTCVTNSKFCYPVLLYLWNRISLDAQVDVTLLSKSGYYQYSDAFHRVFEEEESLAKQSIGVISISQEYIENDSLLLHLKQDFSFKVSWCLNLEADSKIDKPAENTIAYINAAAWENSLNNECAIKRKLTDALLQTLMNLIDGDSLLLCIQSVLTRYMAGLIFILISLFDKFTTILPDQCESICTGQIWIFNNFKNNSATLQHLKNIKEVDSSEEKEVLEVVPITPLCMGSFYIYLRNLNNKHLLQRLKALIAMEKSKMELPVNKQK